MRITSKIFPVLCALFLVGLWLPQSALSDVCVNAENDPLNCCSSDTDCTNPGYDTCAPYGGACASVDIYAPNTYTFCDESSDCDPGVPCNPAGNCNGGTNGGDFCLVGGMLMGICADSSGACTSDTDCPGSCMLIGYCDGGTQEGAQCPMVNLGQCSVTTGTMCVADVDCPTGETCDTLKFCSETCPDTCLVDTDCPGTTNLCTGTNMCCGGGVCESDECFGGGTCEPCNECQDLDGDGWGSPGDVSCPSGPEDDCDDDNTDDPAVCPSQGGPDPCSCGTGACAGCAECIHVGGTDIFGDGIDSNCDNNPNCFITTVLF